MDSMDKEWSEDKAREVGGRLSKSEEILKMTSPQKCALGQTCWHQTWCDCCAARDVVIRSAAAAGCVRLSAAVHKPIAITPCVVTPFDSRPTNAACTVCP